MNGIWLFLLLFRTKHSSFSSTRTESNKGVLVGLRPTCWGSKDPLVSPFLDETKPHGVFCFILAATGRLGFTLQDAFLFEEIVGTAVGNVATLILFLAHEKGIQRVLIDATKRTTKVSLCDPVSSEKFFRLCEHDTHNNEKTNEQKC